MTWLTCVPKIVNLGSQGGGQKLGRIQRALVFIRSGTLKPLIQLF